MKRTLFEEDHDLFRGAFRSFLEQHAVPHREEWLKSGVVDRGLWVEAGKNGFLGMSVPAEYGGGDGAEDFRFNTVIVEEIARSGCSGIGFPLHNDIVQPYLMSLATEEQKHRWMPGFCSGETITAIAMTEPGTGSDLQGIQTNAVRKGDDWVLNGAKTFITNGINADLVIVVAQTEPGSGAKGLTLFVVERGMEGFERGRKLDKIGLRAQDTAELFFQDVVVPQENVLGEVGQAFMYLMQNLAQERLSIAVAAAIAIELSIEMTVEYAKNRKAFGKPIGKFQNTRFVLAELSAEAAAVRALVDRSIEFHLRGELSIPDAAIAKLYSTERQVHVVDRCLQLHGGYGYMLEYPIAQAYVDSRIQTIYGGTSEVMKEIIGRSMAL